MKFCEKQIKGYRVRTDDFPMTAAGKTNLAPLKDDIDFKTKDLNPYVFKKSI